MNEIQVWFRNQRAANRKRASQDDDCLTMVSIRQWVRWDHLYGAVGKDDVGDADDDDDDEN